MPANVYPTMDSTGFLRDPRAKAERILVDYLSTNYSQSNIFFGRLKSLIAAVQNNPNNMPNLANQVNNDLSTLFSAYLENVLVEVTPVEFEKSDGTVNDALYDLQIRVQYSVGNQLEELAKSILVENTGLARLVDIERR